MKLIPALIGAFFISGCAVTVSSDGTDKAQSAQSSSNSSGSVNSNGSAKPYMKEIIQKYGVAETAGQPYGLWQGDQTFTSEDGALTVELFIRVTKDSFSVISACMNNTSKKFSFAPSMASSIIEKFSDGSYGFQIPQQLNNVTDSNGIQCRSSIARGNIALKLDERGMLLIKVAGEVQFNQLQRVK